MWGCVAVGGRVGGRRGEEGVKCAMLSKAYDTYGHARCVLKMRSMRAGVQRSLRRRGAAVLFKPANKVFANVSPRARAAKR